MRSDGRHVLITLCATLLALSGLPTGHGPARNVVLAQEASRSADDNGDTAGSREPLPVEVSDVWFPFAVAKEGLRRSGAWLPIYVELKNLTGRDEIAVLEATAESRFEKEKGQFLTVRKTVDVPPGAPRRVWLTMRAAPSDQQMISLAVTVPRDDSRSSSGSGSAGERGVVVFRQDLGAADTHDLSASGGSMIATLLAGSNLTQLIPRGDWFRMAQFATQSSLVEDQCAPTVLPDSLLGYQPFDVVVLRDFGEERLEPAQITALRRWVFTGGFVVLAASKESGDLLRSELARTLIGDDYVEPTTATFPSDEDDRPGAVVMIDHDAGGWPRGYGSAAKNVLVDSKVMRLNESPSFTIVDPVAPGKGSRGIYMLSPEASLAVEDGGRSRSPSISGPRSNLEEARRLYVELKYGSGHVGVVTFNDQAFDAPTESAFLKPIWKSILGSHTYGDSRLSSEAARFAVNSIVEELRDPTRDIGFSFIVALVVVYLLLVGPGIYFLLKRFHRLPWLIWVEPLFVLVYLAVVIVAGYVSKGAITKAREWTLISQRDGEDLAVRESYLAVFSGAEGDYQIGSPAGVLLKPVFANSDEAAKALGGRREGQRSLVLEEDLRGQRRLTGLHLEQWAEGYAVNFDVVEMDRAGGVQVEVLGETASRNAAAGQTDGLDVRVTNRLPYRILTGTYVHDSEGEFLLPTVDAGGVVEVRLERRLEDSSALPANLPRLEELVRKGFGYGYRDRRPRLIAVIDRQEADYDEEWHTNLRERLDLFLLYRKGGR